MGWCTDYFYRSIRIKKEKDFKKKFLAYMTSIGIDNDIAISECTAYYDDNSDDLDDPVFAAQECMSYWTE